MIRFALCDDNRLQLDLTREILSEYLSGRTEQTSISVFESGDGLIADVRANGPYDVYFLDMIMPGMNGLETASTLRLLRDEGKIVFLTSTSEYAVQSYEVHAYHYLMKPLDRDKLIRITDELIRLYSSAPDDSIEVKTPNGPVFLKPGSVMTVTADNRAPVYRLKNGKEITGITMRRRFREEMSVLLDKPGFIECGVSRIINLACIDQADSESVMMCDGTVIYPPQSAMSTITRKWLDYRRNK